MRQRKGFTIIEALVVITITGILLGVLLANYRRSNENSLLIRETASIMSRIRLAQETGASAEVLGSYCENSLTTKCTVATEAIVCPATPAPRKCIAKPPAGGEMLLFSCTDRANYAWYGDTATCTGGCFQAPTGGTFNMADNIITKVGNWADSVRSTFSIDTKATVKDIRLTSDAGGFPFTYTCVNPSPRVANPPTTPPASPIPAAYPLEAAMQFTSDTGDQFSANIGRKVQLSDNVAIAPPEGGEWKKIELMIGLTNRNTDCRVITMTNTNVLTETVDANCAF